MEIHEVRRGMVDAIGIGYMLMLLRMFGGWKGAKDQRRRVRVV
jgi:hypothetical protein